MQWIYGLADKLEKNGKKMLKNYFPLIPLQSISIPSLTLETLTTSSNAPKAPAESKSKKSETKIESSNKPYYEDDEEITMAEKIKLADFFRVFSPEQNKLLVEYIQGVCLTAFRVVEEKAQIVVDNIDIITFKQIMQ